MSLSPYQPAQSTIRLPAANLVMILLLAVLAVQYGNGNWPFRGGPNDRPPLIDDSKQQPHDESEDRPDLTGSYLVVVEESKSRSVERVKILNDYEFWFGLRDRGLKGFRILDPDSSDSKSFVAEAGKRSISHPFVMHVSADGRVLNTIPFPKQIAEIEGMLK